MAFRTICLLPGCADINGMLKVKGIPDVSQFGFPRSALTNYSMTKVTVFCNRPACFRFEIIVMAPETTRGFKMPNMFRINIIGNLHSRESILAERLLNRLDCVIYNITPVFIEFRKT